MANTKKVTAVEAQEQAIKSAPVSSNDTVTIALNWPRSIIFDVKDNSGITHQLTLNGNGAFLKGRDMGILEAGAFGMTPNVSRELWEALESQWLSHAPWKNLVDKGLIFASGSTNSANAEAAEKKSTRNGIEAVDPKKTATKEATAE